MNTPEEPKNTTPTYYYYDSAAEEWKQTTVEELKSNAQADWYVCQQLANGEFGPAITYAELEKQLQPPAPALPPVPELPPIPKASAPNPLSNLRSNIKPVYTLSNGEIRPGIETSRMSRKDFIGKWKEWIRNNKFWLIAQVVVLLLFIATIIPACIYEKWELLIFALLLIPAKIGIAIKLFISGLRYQKFYKMRCHDLGYSMGHYIAAIAIIPFAGILIEAVTEDELDRANRRLDRQLEYLETLEREQSSIENSASYQIERLEDQLDNGSISASEYASKHNAIVRDYERKMASIEDRFFSSSSFAAEADEEIDETQQGIIALVITLASFAPLTYLLLRLFFKEGSKSPNKYGPAPTVPYSNPE